MSDDTQQPIVKKIKKGAVVPTVGHGEIAYADRDRDDGLLPVSALAVLAQPSRRSSSVVAVETWQTLIPLRSAIFARDGRTVSVFFPRPAAR